MKSPINGVRRGADHPETLRDLISVALILRNTQTREPRLYGELSAVLSALHTAIESAKGGPLS